MTDEKISEICKAIGDSNRLNIIKLLSKGELCACKLLEAFKITQPTLSHHMKILSEADIVFVRKEGKWSYYSINHKIFNEFQSYFEKNKLCNPSNRTSSKTSKTCCGDKK